jgi:hypothetical protein
MAKIGSYPNDNGISFSDRLIGTDADNNDATNNYLISDLIDFIIANASFVPYDGATQNVNLGTYVLIAGSLQLSSSLELGANSPLFLNGDEGILGQLLVSVGPGFAPQWIDAPFIIPGALKYGMFLASTSQAAAVVDTAYPMIFDITDSDTTNGITVESNGVSTTRITPSRTGVYNVEVSAQLRRGAAGGAETVSIWMRKGGVDTAYSNKNIGVPVDAGALVVATWSFLANINTDDANPYVEVVWATSSTDISLEYSAPFGVAPETPSITLTVTQVNV